jgi:glutamate-1-semialdehyde 2,1-aminomutase
MKTTMKSKSLDLLARNSEVIPGGLASINRKTEPCIAFARAKGARMWDLDGNE